MRAVIQRVLNAKVVVNDRCIGEIPQGLLIFFGVGKDSVLEKIPNMAKKIANLRIFNDQNGKMNLSCIDTQRSALVVSQFTLYANCKKGRRPDFFDAAPPLEGKEMYNLFVKELKKHISQVETGEFGGDMKISLVNDGPVTIMLDQKDL